MAYSKSFPGRLVDSPEEGDQETYHFLVVHSKLNLSEYRASIPILVGVSIHDPAFLWTETS